MDDYHRERLVGNLIDHPGKAKKRIQMRQAALFFKMDPDCSRCIAKGLELEVRDIEHLTEIKIVP